MDTRREKRIAEAPALVSTVSLLVSVLAHLTFSLTRIPANKLNFFVVLTLSMQIQFFRRTAKISLIFKKINDSLQTAFILAISAFNFFFSAVFYNQLFSPVIFSCRQARQQELSTEHFLKQKRSLLLFTPGDALLLARHVKNCRGVGGEAYLLHRIHATEVARGSKSFLQSLVLR